MVGARLPLGRPPELRLVAVAWDGPEEGWASAPASEILERLAAGCPRRPSRATCGSTPDARDLGTTPGLLQTAALRCSGRSPRRCGCPAGELLRAVRPSRLLQGGGVVLDVLRLWCAPPRAPLLLLLGFPRRSGAAVASGEGRDSSPGLCPSGRPLWPTSASPPRASA